MIVCVCRGVSDRRIRQEIENGASSIADLRACGIGDQCGSCHSMLKTMLAEAVAADARVASVATACACGEAPAEVLSSAV